VAEVGRIQIEVDARQVDKAARALNDLGLKSQATGRKVSGFESKTEKATKATAKMSKVSRGLTRTLGLLGAGLGGLTFVGLARSIERATTQLNNIEATMQVAAGSAQAAGRQIAFIRQESDRLGLFFPTVAKQMAQFSAAARGTSITGAELEMIFTGISEASRAMGLTAPEAEGAMKALQQMMSKGKVSAEELRQQLGERMPGSIQIMAASLDVTTQKLFEMMENGELLADEVLPKFGREMSNVFGAAAEVQANKIAAAIQRLQTAFFDLMAQDGLSGATDAIDKLADVLGSDSFQNNFDNIVRMVSNLGTVMANNLGVIAAFGASLAGLALTKIIQMFAGLAKSFGLVAAGARGAIPALGGFAIALNGVKRALLALAGPVGAIAAIISAVFAFKAASKEARLEASFLELSLEEIDDRIVNIKDSADEAGLAVLQMMQKSAQPGFEQFLRDSKAIAEVQRRIAELSPEVQESIESTGRSIFNVPGGRELNRLRAQLRSLIAARDEFAEDAEAFAALDKAIRQTADEMERLEDSAINTEKEFNDLKDSATDLMEELFPERAALREYLEGLSLIESALEEEIITAREAAMARKELNRNFQENTSPNFKDTEDQIKGLTKEQKSALEVLAQYDDELAKGLEQREKIQQLTNAYEVLGMASEEAAKKAAQVIDQNTLSDFEQGVKNIADAIEGDLSSSLTDVIMDVESLSDAFSSLAEQIARTVIQQQISDPFAREIGNFAQDIIPTIFGGGSPSGPESRRSAALGADRANGGNVFSNKAHLVGERGPEMFVPGQDGRIIPNAEMGGGGDVTVNIINQGGEQLQAEQQQSRRGANGEMTVDVMVKSSMERLDSQGQLDGIFRRHGAARQGQF